MPPFPMLVYEFISLLIEVYEISVLRFVNCFSLATSLFTSILLPYCTLLSQRFAISVDLIFKTG